MRLHDVRAMLAESIVVDPDLTEAQRTGYQSGWQMAAATSTEELTESAISLAAECLHADRDGAASSQLLGFLAYQQSLILELSACLPTGNRLQRICPEATAK